MKKDYINKYYAATKNFKLTNPNPCWKDKRGLKWDRGDCAIRALANSIDCSWIEAYDYLSVNARRDFNVPNDMGGFRKWTVENGAVWCGFKAEKGKKRMTCLEFAQKYNKGRFVIEINNHLTACVNGVLLDAWNPSEEYMHGYLDMNNFAFAE